MKSLLQLSLLFMISLSYAGTETHGGDAIVCYDRSLYNSLGQIDKDAIIVGYPEVKDFWEHSQLSFYKIDIDENESNYKVILENLITRLIRLHPGLGNKLMRSFLNLDRHLKFISRSRIPQIDDSISTVIPDETNFCYDRQAAFQLQRAMVGQAKFYIDKRIFDHMKPKDQAGLVLHELVLEQFNAIHQRANNRRSLETTDNVRYFTFMISSNFMTLKNRISDYLKIISSTQAEDFFDRNIIKLNIDGFELRISGKQLGYLNNYGSSIYFTYIGQSRMILVDDNVQVLDSGKKIFYDSLNDRFYYDENGRKYILDLYYR